MNEEFRSLLSSMASQLGNVPERVANYYPPNSDYNAQVTKIDRNVYRNETTGKVSLNWSLTFQYVTPEVAGKATVKRYTTERDKSYGELRALVHLTTGVESPANPVELDNQVEVCLNAFYRVRVRSFVGQDKQEQQMMDILDFIPPQQA